MSDKPWVKQTPCSHVDCTASIPDHYWGRTNSDWFFQRDGHQYCPEHIPEWVGEWRRSKQEAGSEPPMSDA